EWVTLAPAGAAPDRMQRDRPNRTCRRNAGTGRRRERKTSIMLDHPPQDTPIRSYDNSALTNAGTSATVRCPSWFMSAFKMLHDGWALRYALGLIRAWMNPSMSAPFV